MNEEEKILFEPYERKIRNQQNEIRKLKKELEYMRKVLHRKNLDGMRQCRRRKEQKEEIEELDKRLEQAIEIIRELGGIVREGVTCHVFYDNGTSQRWL